jgi:PAS domain S-box-containing protein
MFRNFKIRLLLSHLALIIFAMALTAFLFLGWLQAFTMKKFEAPLASNARFFSRYIGTYLDKEEDLFVAARFFTRNFSIDKNLRLRVFNLQGLVLMDTVKSVSNGGGTMEAQALGTLTEKEKTWISRSGNERFIHVSVPIYLKGSVLGGADVSTSLSEVDSSFRVMKLRFALAVMVSFAAAIILALFLTKTLIRPVLDVRDAAASIARGELSTRVKYISNDELGQLGETVNYMAERLELQIRQILNEKNKMKALLFALLDGVVAIDLAGKITYVNESAARLLGLEEQGWLNHPLEDVFRVDEVQFLVRESLNQNKIVSREISYGEGVLFLFILPVLEAEARIGSMLIIRDVTELRRLEVARSQFLSNVSHELRTPLTIIKGFVMTLINGENQGEENIRHLNQINSETDRLSRLVDDLLELSRLKSRKFTLQNSWTDPAGLILKTAENMKPQALRYGIELSVDIKGKISQALLDPDRISQVLLNLVDNAVKFTPRGGRVEISAREAGGEIIIEVSDTGGGIPREELPFVFERFFRSKEKSAHKVPGSGLGLAIVKEIIEAHRGKISVRSREGDGTVFSLSLPLAPRGTDEG